MVGAEGTDIIVMEQPGFIPGIIAMEQPGRMPGVIAKRIIKADRAYRWIPDPPGGITIEAWREHVQESLRAKDVLDEKKVQARANSSTRLASAWQGSRWW